MLNTEYWKQLYSNTVPIHILYYSQRERVGGGNIITISWSLSIYSLYMSLTQKTYCWPPPLSHSCQHLNI